ncbi:hypothetical protein [Pseudomonas sp. LB3P25]
MSSIKNRVFDLMSARSGSELSDFCVHKFEILRVPASHNFNLARLLHGGTYQVRFPCGVNTYQKEPRENQVLVMIHYSTSDEIKACRAFALERNRQMFQDAQALSRSAWALLEVSDMDVELFDRYQAMRRKADLKFEEAIEHLRLLNEDFPPISTSTHNVHRLHPALESRT